MGDQVTLLGRAAWRDVDHPERIFGFRIWRTGGEVSLGHRLYRVRWVRL